MAHQRSSPGEGNSDAHRFGQSILKKGKACVNCRRRKMKCDGVQPICGSCRRTGKAEDCEYTSGSERSTSQRLEAEVQRLQSRIRDLQTTSNSNHGVLLQQPYAPESLERQPASLFQDPPQHIAQRLLDVFLAHSSQFGFFLHPTRFRNSVSSPGPVGHESRPSPSLLATVYLFGIYLSQDPELKHHEKTYFDLSLQHVSRDTSSTTTHPNHRLHVIQTEVLLTHYFFANNRSIEGKYHCYSAYSLAIASGIHKMGARNPPELTLPPAADDIEEGERINAYWAIFCLDKEWAGVFNCNPNITCSASNGIRLVTPMPREIEEYETGRYRCDLRRGHTIENFVSGSESPGETLTSRALHVKAALLFERSRAFSRGLDLTSQQGNDLAESFRHARNLAVTFKSTLSPLDAWLHNPNLDIVRTAYVGITLLDAALIRLHGIAVTTVQGDSAKAQARQQRLFHAQEIFNNSMRLASTAWNFVFLNPIVGHAWREAFDVLFEELNSRRTAQSSSHSGWLARPPHPSGQSEDPLRRQLRKGVASFSIYSNSCAFIRDQFEDMTNTLHGTAFT